MSEQKWHWRALLLSSRRNLLPVAFQLAHRRPGPNKPLFHPMAGARVLERPLRCSVPLLPPQVRLNRALEELERYRAKLREMREDREGAGQGARAEAQRLASENNRLRKRQAELLLAFRKQVPVFPARSPSTLRATNATLTPHTRHGWASSLVDLTRPPASVAPGAAHRRAQAAEAARRGGAVALVHRGGVHTYPRAGRSARIKG